MIILPFILFIIDFLSSACIQQWLLYTLLAYFFILLSTYQKTMREALYPLILPFILLLLQDFFLYGRLGLILVPLALLMLIAFIVNKIIINPAPLLPFFFGYFFICEDFLIKKYLFLQNPHGDVTIKKICINLVVGYLVLWGTRGNRLFSMKMEGRRKVWTPNRKDAS